jgi:hypothetical protein
MSASFIQKDVRRVFLSGPITGCSQEQSSNWRQYVRERFSSGIITIDPTRDSVDSTVVSERELDEAARLHNLTHGKEILDRNRQDIARCDIVLANFLGAQRVSIGAVGELFWADIFRKPVIVVREVSHNPHDHGLINAIAFLTLHSLESAIEKINRFLL